MSGHTSWTWRARDASGSSTRTSNRRRLFALRAAGWEVIQVSDYHVQSDVMVQIVHYIAQKLG